MTENEALARKMTWLVVLVVAMLLAGCGREPGSEMANDSTADSNARGGQAADLGRVAKLPSATLSTSASSPSSTSTVAPSTRKMAALLKEISAGVNVDKLMWNVNDRRAEAFRERLAIAASPSERAKLQFLLANELLNDGRNPECLKALDDFEHSIRDHGLKVNSFDRDNVRMLRIQAYLRIGEMENCCALHNADSCLLPLRGGAIYQVTEGPRHAIELLNEQLAEHPKDLCARWLLNLAYMTLGEYPHGVPDKWLIDPKAFSSEYDIKRFPDVAKGAKLDAYGLSGGCIVDDFDGDGLLDVVRSEVALDGQLRFFHNNGDGTFSDRTRAAGLTGEVGGLNILQADYNNSGYPSILVLRGGWMNSEGRFPVSLLRNNGDGTFTDVTEEAGLLKAVGPAHSAVWFDYDGDGWLDLFIGRESSEGLRAPCQLFHNNRDGTFTECAAECGLDIVEFVKGVCCDDYDNDGRPDVFISRFMGPDGQRLPGLLFHNDGPRDPSDPSKGWKFTEVGQAAGITRVMHSFPCWFFDYDNDGRPDIFACGYSIDPGPDRVAADYLGLRSSDGQYPCLYHNNGDGTFTDVTSQAGLEHELLGMGANFGDLDNDGFLDFYIGTGNPMFTVLVPNRMFRNDGGKRFQDVTTSGGFGNLQKGHAVAFASLRNNGQQDIYEEMGGANTGDKFYSVLYANPGHVNHWIGLKLEGTRSNRGAVGARIHVSLTTKSGRRNIYRTVSSGGSFGANPLRQEIGLGDALSVESIDICWPAAGVPPQHLGGVPMDRYYKIREGASAAEPWTVPTFEYRHAPSVESANPLAQKPAAMTGATIPQDSTLRNSEPVRRETSAAHGAFNRLSRSG